MDKPIVNPPIPYVGPVPESFHGGNMVRIQGITPESGDRFNINLQLGPNERPRDDTALHISVRFNQGYVARNTYQGGNWGDEDGSGTLPIGFGQRFEIIVLCDKQAYKIAINGQHFCEFRHKLPKDQVTHLLINGDVAISLISWENSMPVVEPSGDHVAAQASNVHSSGPSAPSQGYAGPPQGYGAPPQGYGSPQQGYGPPPQGYGSPQQGYGPPPPGYGPPLPPGAQKESGLDNFFESAQSILAGAIASGAAEKLIGGIFSSNQQPHTQAGYAPQNAQYGQYPQLPPQNQQSDFQLPHLGGGGGSVGGFGSFLTSLAGQVLHNQREGPQGSQGHQGPRQYYNN